MCTYVLHVCMQTHATCVHTLRMQTHATCVCTHYTCKHMQTHATCVHTLHMQNTCYMCIPMLSHMVQANRLYRQPPVSVGTAMSSGPSSTDNSGDQSRLSSTKMSDILEALKILEEEPHPLDPVRPLSSVPQSTGSFTPWEAGVESKQTQQGQPDHSKFRYVCSTVCASCGADPTVEYSLY